MRRLLATAAGLAAGYLFVTWVGACSGRVAHTDPPIDWQDGGAPIQSYDANVPHWCDLPGSVVFNGKRQRIYHYVATADYPYTVGCFRGTSALRGPTVPPGGAP